VGVYHGRSRSVQGVEAGGGLGRRGGWGWLGTAESRVQRVSREQRVRSRAREQRVRSRVESRE
jgi:hypothetical protein